MRRVAAILAAAAVAVGFSAAAAAPASAAAPTGYIAHYAFDDPAGSDRAADTSGNGLDAIVDPLYPGVQFHGADGYATFTNGLLIGPAVRIGGVTITVSVKVRLALPPDQHPSGNIEQLGNSRAADGGGIVEKIATAAGSSHTPGTPKFTVNGTAVWGTASIADGQWHVIVGEDTGTSLILTVDGRQVRRRNVTVGPLDRAAPIYLGGKYDRTTGRDPRDSLRGDLGYVRISR